MHILITGGTGFIGSAAVASFLEQGYSITILSRTAHPDQVGVRFITDIDAIDSDTVIDAIVNLAGASMAGKRWSVAYKKELLASRLDTTRALASLCERLSTKPGVLLSGSAIGFYGPHKDERLEESAAAIDSFSSELCRLWEDEASQMQRYGVRVCLLRLGVVLANKGGALEQMAQPFKFGVANWIGTGQQWLSWVHRDDVVAALNFLLLQQRASGAFNVTAPNPVTARDFCAALKRRYRTFITVPLPGFFMRLVVGEMADELLIAGQRVIPAALQQAGFEFEYPKLADALAA